MSGAAGLGLKFLTLRPLGAGWGGHRGKRVKGKNQLKITLLPSVTRPCLSSKIWEKTDKNDIFPDEHLNLCIDFSITAFARVWGRFLLGFAIYFERWRKSTKIFGKGWKWQKLTVFFFNIFGKSSNFQVILPAVAL